jgi:hypothetical protein
MEQLVPLKNGLFTDFRIDQVKKLICGRLHELNMVNAKYKLDNEFLTFLTNMIEILVDKKDKINKRDLALSIFKEHFGATDEEVELIGKNIDYLHNNKVIKKASWYKMFKCTVKEYFKKK